MPGPSSSTVTRMERADDPWSRSPESAAFGFGHRFAAAPASLAGAALLGAWGASASVAAASPARGSGPASPPIEITVICTDEAAWRRALSTRLLTARSSWTRDP